ncbi:aromatic compound dioxygenase [Peniophora sp. CONT]|nr:aromatic compound dioxygenase [Peniophora sp. CONT]
MATTTTATNGTRAPSIPLKLDFSESSNYTITDHVREVHAKFTTPRSPRLAFVIDRLVTHLHAFAREVQLTQAEWTDAVGLIERAGKESTELVNEIVLLSDCLGLSWLVDEMDHPRPVGATEGSEEGPFYTKDFPEVPSGTSIAHADTAGQPLFFEATVKNLKGEGIPDAKVEVWQADGNGIYDLMYDEPPANGADDRARIKAEPSGHLSYRGVLPVAYHVPDSGPSGAMLAALGRDTYRPSHLHFRIKAPGYDTLTTQLYPSNSAFLGTDPVFGTRKSLICDLEEVTDAAKWAEWGFDKEDVVKRGGRVWAWRYGFVLATVDEVKQEREKRHSAASKL